MNQKITRKQSSLGFTLLEILVALFIFTFVALILATGLHSIMNTQARIEQHAEKLEQLNKSLLLFSNDIEQCISRPIFNADGNEELALSGSRHEISFTHAGLTNPNGILQRSTLQRTQYSFENHQWIRTVWASLDPTTKTHSTSRVLLTDVSDIQIEYINAKSTIESRWPVFLSSNIDLPKAIRITLKLKNNGDIQQTYLIPGDERVK